jgi:serine/threonine protein kinase
MTLASGTNLGRYEIRSKIGEGGMGEVLSPWHSRKAKIAANIIPSTKSVK